MDGDENLRLDPEEVCELQPDELAERVAWVKAWILPHALATSRLEDGIAIELDDAPGLARRVDDWIELERQCCPGISFERRASAAPGRLRFEMRGVDPTASLLEALAAPRPRRFDAARVAKATGLGLGLSVFVCCVFPLAAGALLGAAAAPLTALDAPVPIAGGAFIGGLAAWWWLGRGHSGDEAVAEECGPRC